MDTYRHLLLNNPQSVVKRRDTYFLGEDGENGGKYLTPDALSLTINSLWPDTENKFVVFTGGEPLLQLDVDLISNLKNLDFEIAVETNGTITALEGIDWITVSPKAGSKLVQKSGSELKIVLPQKFELKEFETLDLSIFYYLQ